MIVNDLSTGTRGGPRLGTVCLGRLQVGTGHKDVQTAGKSSQQPQNQPQVLLSGKRLGGQGQAGPSEAQRMRKNRPDKE